MFLALTRRLAVELSAMASRCFASARECRACERLVPGSAVAGVGPIGARVMFVGEAPGRLGAGRTGVPFSGDEAGRRFERLLAETGLRRDEVFVTNAVLCLPLDTTGRNRRPRESEVRNCGTWLAAEIERVQPAYVVALGTVALAALGRIEAHELVLSRDVGRVVEWRGRKLVALYHPGARSAVRRGWELQVGDWREFPGEWCAVGD